MDDISSIIGSLSDEQIERLKSIASSIAPSFSPPALSEDDGKLSAGSSLTSIMQSVNSSDEKTELIRALKPFLSDSKRQRADEAIRLLKLMRILPLLRGLNINDLPL